MSYAESHHWQKYSLCLTVLLKTFMLVWLHPPLGFAFALPTSEGEAEAPKINATKKRTRVETLRDLMIAK